MKLEFTCKNKKAITEILNRHGITNISFHSWRFGKEIECFPSPAEWEGMEDEIYNFANPYDFPKYYETREAAIEAAKDKNYNRVAMFRLVPVEESGAWALKVAEDIMQAAMK